MNFAFQGRLRSSVAGSPQWGFAIRVNSVQWRAWALVVALAIGATFRVTEWAGNQPLWLDEAYLANQILPRPWPAMFRPLGGAQSAPVGYVLLVKALAEALGDGERVLRLASLVAGLAAMPLGVAVFRSALPPAGRWVAALLLILAGPAVYYSAEFKQYAVESLVTLLCLGAAFAYVDRPSARRAWWLGACGAVGLVFSLPAVFVLGSVGVVLLFSAWRNADGVGLRRIVCCGAAWAVVLGLNWVFFLRVYAASEFFKTFWVGGFMPLPPRSLGEWRWLPTAVQALQQTLLGFEWRPAQIVSTVLAIVGFAWLARRGGTKGRIVVGVVLLSLLAAALHRYPFQQRLQFFALPCWAAAVGAGVMMLLERPFRFLRVCGCVAAGLLVVTQLFALAWWENEKSTWPDLRWAHAEIEKHRDADTPVYVDARLAATLRYYAWRADRGRPLAMTVFAPEAVDPATLPAGAGGGGRLVVTFDTPQARHDATVVSEKPPLVIVRRQ